MTPSGPASVPARIGHRLQSGYRRATTSPFAAPGDRSVLVHCGHHKSGTVWFRQVILEVTRAYGLRFRAGTRATVSPEADVVFFDDAGKYRRDALGDRPFRGSHLVRDPRDLVVSGYEYHLVTTEEWATAPQGHFGGVSYQDYLRSMSEADGLMAEITWLTTPVTQAMAAWDYTQPEFLELRYEDVLQDEAGAFERLFRWYGFDDRAVAAGVAAAERLSLRQGGAKSGHVRSGAPGEWRTRLGPDHLARFKEVTGDLVVRLGYEDDPDW